MAKTVSECLIGASAGICWVWKKTKKLLVSLLASAAAPLLSRLCHGAILKTGGWGALPDPPVGRSLLLKTDTRGFYFLPGRWCSADIQKGMKREEIHTHRLFFIFSHEHKYCILKLRQRHRNAGCVRRASVSRVVHCVSTFLWHVSGRSLCSSFIWLLFALTTLPPCLPSILVISK